MLSVETKRTTQEEQQREDRGFRHLGAPGLSLGLDAVAFGPGPAAVKFLFKTNPSVFEGTNIADGTNMPNFKNVFVGQLLREIEQRLLAGQSLLSFS
jgi:hypothetical protein